MIDQSVMRIFVEARGIAKVNAQLAGMNAQMQTSSARAGGMGAALKKGLMVGGAAIAAAGVALYKLGEAFDDAYDTIRVGTGATGKKLEGLKGDFKDVVRAVPASFGDASTAVADLNTRLGLTGKPLQTSAKQFLELSRITKTDVKANIKDVTRAFGDWEVKTKDQGGQLDKFFRAAQSSGATVGDLAKQVVQFGAPLRQVGFSLDEATAMFANFEKAGVNTQTMMPGIKMAMKTFFEKGIDPKKGLTAAFKGIQDGSIDASAAIKIFGTRAGGDMIEAVKQGRFNLDAMTKTLANGSDTIMKAGKDTMDFSERWLMFKNKVLVALEPVAIRVFDGMGKLMEVLPPIAGRVVDVIATLVAPLVAVGKAVAENKTALFALGAAAGVLLTAFVGFQAFAGIMAIVRGMAGAFWALNAAMAANPIGLVVIAIAALVAGLVVAYRESETFRAIVDAVWKALKTAASAVFPVIVAAITGAWNIIKAVTSAVWGAIGGFLTTAFNVIKAVAGAVFPAIGSVISTVWSTIKTVTSAVWNAISSALSTVWNVIKGAASLAWDGIKTVIVNPITAVVSFGKTQFENFKLGLGVIWNAIKSAAGTAWGFIRDNIVDPIRSAAGRVSEIVGGIKSRVKGVFDDIVGFAKDFGSNVADKVTSAFKGVAGVVTKFAIKILEVIDLIPGVSMKGPIKTMQAGAKELGLNGFARGGAYGATGGVIDRPMALFGEEAPLHKEIVIPSNPAYRKRAQALVGQAANMVGVPGFAEGGVVSAFKGAASRTGASQKPTLALFEAGIVESGLRNLSYGDRDSRGALQIRDSTARGMGINNMDPFASAMAFLTRGFWGRGGAIALSRGGGSAGQVAQNTQGSAFGGRYDQVRDQALAAMGGGGGGGGGGILGAISGAAGAVGGVLGDLLSKGAGFILDKLPGVGDLPDWLKGTGKYALREAGDWIKDKVAGLVGAGGGGGGAGGPGVMTGTNAKAAKLAKMFGATITSGYRSAASNAAANGAAGSSHMKGSPSNPGAHDFVPASSALLAEASKMGAKWVDNHDFGSGLHSHVSWFAQGGKYGQGLLGSYAGGTDYVPRTGPYMLHRGESVAPASGERGRSDGMTVNFNAPVTVGSAHSAQAAIDRVAFRLKYS